MSVSEEHTHVLALVKRCIYSNVSYVISIPRHLSQGHVWRCLLRPLLWHTHSCQGERLGAGRWLGSNGWRVKAGGQGLGGKGWGMRSGGERLGAGRWLVRGLRNEG